jgi:hypothetical protein
LKIEKKIENSNNKEYCFIPIDAKRRTSEICGWSNLMGYYLNNIGEISEISDEKVQVYFLSKEDRSHEFSFCIEDLFYLKEISPKDLYAKKTRIN